MYWNGGFVDKIFFHAIENAQFEIECSRARFWESCLCCGTNVCSYPVLDEQSLLLT